MADMYSYSGHKLPALPELPEGCTHAVIYYDTEDSVYYLFCSSERIVYNENNVPQLPATTSWGGYACRAGGTYWFSATFTPEGDVENPDYYLLDQVLLWTNTDICQKDTDTVVLAATTPLQYPTITSISSSRSYTLGEEAETLICEASVNDGELSYQWYHGEEAVGEGNSYTPDVSVVGSEGYYCIVTNTVSDTQLTTTSKTITITVEEEKKFPVVAYVSGLVARLHSRRMPYPYSHRAPVAYLYNGIRLPALPEWDKANNPCAAIMRIEVDGVACALLAVAQYADSRFAIRSNDSGDPVVRVKVSGYYVGINSFNCIAMFYAPLSGGEWVATTESFSCNAEDLIWSNFDVADARTEDEAIFLAASTPVPVYE